MRNYVRTDIEMRSNTYSNLITLTNQYELAEDVLNTITMPNYTRNKRVLIDLGLVNGMGNSNEGYRFIEGYVDEFNKVKVSYNQDLNVKYVNPKKVIQTIANLIIADLGKYVFNHQEEQLQMNNVN